MIAVTVTDRMKVTADAITIATVTSLSDVQALPAK